MHAPLALRLALTATLALSACRTAAVTETNSANAIAAAPGASNEDVVAQPVAQPVAQDASPAIDAAVEASVVADETPSPLELRLRAIAGDTAALRAAIVAPRGLSLVEVLEAPPNGRGRERRSAEQLCGAALDRRAESVRQTLVALVRRADEGMTVQCHDNVCLVPGQEYEPTRRVYFTVAPEGGAPMIEAIVITSEAAIEERWVAAARAYVDRSLAAHRRARCR
jgi:hypothetical protein